MDNILRLQMKTGSNERTAFFHETDMFLTIFQQLLISGCFVYCAVTACANSSMVIRCINNCFCVHFCDIVAYDFKWHIFPPLL